MDEQEMNADLHEVYPIYYDSGITYPVVTRMDILS